MASILKYETKKGTFYRATVYAGIDPTTGKQVNITKRGFKTKKAANAWADKTRVKIANGEKRESLEQKQTTLRDVYERWFAQYRLDVKPSTANKTDELFRLHILPDLGEKRLQALKTSDIQDVVNEWYRAPLSHYKTMYNYTKRVLDYAVREKIITANPAADVIVPRKQREVETDEPPCWSKEELNQFLNACKEDERPAVYPFFRLLAYTGMRRGEILALTWSDIKGNEININKALTVDAEGHPVIGTTKTARSKRVIIIDDETSAIMEHWRQHPNRGEYVFGANKPMSESIPRKWMQQICKRANVRPIKIHGLRHTHCSILFEAGATVKEVQDRLGHSSADITLSVYTHLSERQKKNTPNLFTDFLNS